MNYAADNAYTLFNKNAAIDHSKKIIYWPASTSNHEEHPVYMFHTSQKQINYFSATDNLNVFTNNTDSDE